MSEALAMRIAQAMTDAEFDGATAEEVEAAYEDAHGMWTHGSHPDPSDGQKRGPDA